MASTVFAGLLTRHPDQTLATRGAGGLLLFLSVSFAVFGGRVVEQRNKIMFYIAIWAFLSMTSCTPSNTKPAKDTMKFYSYCGEPSAIVGSFNGVPYAVTVAYQHNTLTTSAIRDPRLYLILKYLGTVPRWSDRLRECTTLGFSCTYKNKITTFCKGGA